MSKKEGLNIKGAVAVYERAKRLIRGVQTNMGEDLKGWLILENLYNEIKPFENEINPFEGAMVARYEEQFDEDRGLLVVDMILLREAIKLYEDKGRFILGAERRLNGLLDGEPQQKPKEQAAEQQRYIPDELMTDEALTYWEKAKEMGFVDDNYKFNGTRYQRTYFAMLMAEKLNLKPKWKPFIKLWGYKYFAQDKRGIKEKYGKVDKQKDIEAIFD